MTSLRMAWLVGLCLITTAQAQGIQEAQSVSSQFDVISIKPHASNNQQVSMVAQPGGRFVAVNVPVRMLIRTAYQLQDDQIVGADGWIAAEGFDIDAKGSAAPAAQVLPRLQSLLAERFQLVTHRETREAAVYRLERSFADGKLGQRLRPTRCPPLDQDPSDPMRCAATSTGLGRLTLRGMPMSQFLPFLAQQLHRVVVDGTGLTARYDIDLAWRPDPPPGGQAAAETLDADSVSIFTAVQEQLGLKLRSTRAPIGVLIIDAIERPTSN